MASYKNIEEYRRKKKIRKIGGRILVIVLLLAVLCLVLYGVKYVEENSLTDKITGGLSAEEQKFPLTIKKEQLMDIQPLEEGFAVLSKSNVLTYTNVGKRQQTIPHGYTNPVMRENGKRLLTYDRGGNRFRVDTGGKKIGEITTDSAILTAAISPGGNVAVAMTYQSNTPVIAVYDANLRITYRNYTPEEFLYADFSPDGSHLLLTGVDTREGLLSAALYELDVTREADPVVTEVADILPLRAIYTGQGIQLVGSDGVVTIRRNGEQSRWSARGDLQHLALMPDGTVIMANSNILSNYSTVTAIGPDGSELGSVELQDEVLDIGAREGNILILGKKSLYQYDGKMSLLEETKLEKSCIKVTLSGGFAYIMSEDGVEQKRLK